MTTRVVLDIPEPVKAALREVHRRLPERRPFAEMSAALDAVAALPEASHPDAREAIARERLDIVGRCPATEEEVERVLEEHADMLAGMDTFERAMIMRAACLGRRELSERYLTPLLAEAEERDPDDRSRLATILRHALAHARDEVELLQLDEDAPKMPEDFMEGIRHAYRLRRMGWPYGDAMAALDEVEKLPSATGYAGQLALDRIIMTEMYGRPDDEMEREIQRALVAEAAAPAWVRASTIMSACDRRVALAEKYIPGLVAAAETELREHPDDEVAQKYLDGVKIRLERTRGGS